MKIERVDIWNYRGIRECHLDLSHTGGLVVVAGLNGSGKTSLIEAVRLALGQFYGIRSVPTTDFRIIVDGINRQGERISVERTRTSHTLRDGSGGVYPVQGEEMARRLDVNADWFFSSWRDPALSAEVDIQEQKDFASLRNDRTKELTFEMVRDYLVRASVQAQYNQNPVEINAVQGLYQRFSDAWNLFFPNRAATFVTQAVGSVLSDNGFGASAGKSKLPFRLYLRHSSNEEMISVHDLSSGELEIFCFLGVLISKVPTPDLIYIDEPELHLNQQWHTLLMHALRIVAPNAQFLVATHSPDVWNSVLTTQRFFIQDGFLSNIHPEAR